jgi:hypothetical protein
LKKAEHTILQSAYQEYLDAFECLHQQPVFGLTSADKQTYLLPALNALHRHHQIQCSVYANITGSSYQRAAFNCQNLTELDYLAVRLFKSMRLSSIAAEDVFKTLQSSGTTSQVTAKVVLDRETSQRQSKVLVAIMQQILGKARLPMLIIDAKSTVQDRSKFNARAAGIQGLAFFGRDHTYALNEKMQPDWAVIDEFCERHKGKPVLVFGFTFMVWQYFVSALEAMGKNIALPTATLIHSGGWKKLDAEKVDNKTFKQRVIDATGIFKIHNFYGMAEQVGSIFLECDSGHLHAPSCADLVIRDPIDLSVAPMGKQGIIQVVSAVPSSYPGHSLLTEDIGILHGEDDCSCGWKGKYFSVVGRLPKAEIRGCSDTHTRLDGAVNEQ